VFSSTVSLAIASAVEGRRLLDHPYYQKWQLGGLALEDLGEYAEQYRYFEQALPEVLLSVSRTLGPGPIRGLVEKNWHDEVAEPEPHVELFDRFAVAVGASGDAGPSPATNELVGVYRAGAIAGPVPALAVIAGYETQAAAIAATKSDALRRHYGFDAHETEFWDVHAGIEESHASWTAEALARLGANATTIEEWASRSAIAWWTYLDEREAACN
jgi:pyrroloquinoline quinone (PQQ) biosynthesis protein C